LVLLGRMHVATIAAVAVATSLAGWLLVGYNVAGVHWSTRLGYLAYIVTIAPTVFLYLFVARWLASTFVGWAYAAAAFAWCVLAAVPMYWLAFVLSLGLLAAASRLPWLSFVPISLTINVLCAAAIALAFLLLALWLFWQLLAWSRHWRLRVKQ